MIIEALEEEWDGIFEEYEKLNKKIARQGATLDDIINTVIANPHSFPTVSLDSQRLADLYGLNIERAQVKTSQVL